MNTLRSIIIDSSNFSLRVLEDLILKTPAITLEKKFLRFAEAGESCREKSPDLIICNIDSLNKDLVDSIKNTFPFAMIVCAGDRETIEQKGLEENIFGYLYKPYSHERILSIVSKAGAYISYNCQNHLGTRKPFVFIKSEYKTIRIDLEDILYCEGLKDYTQIHLRNKPKPVVTLQNLKSIMEKLPSTDFVRVHRSYIVSIDKVDAISRNEISIGQSEIPIGDAFREKLFELIEDNS
jgi:DNA-binding LytR/AlgR family response regulator